MNEIDKLSNQVHQLLSQQGANEQSRVVMDGDGLRLDGQISTFQWRSSASKDSNSQIRSMLLNALVKKFDGVVNIPKSVRDAMKLDDFASGYSLSSDGKQIKVTPRPLSLRRIVAILDAAKACPSRAYDRAVFSPRRAVASLLGPTIDKNALSASLVMLQMSLNKMVEHEEIQMQDMDRAAEGFLAAAVQGLTNKELLEAFHKMGTDEYQKISWTLPDHARCNMFVLDALITREISHRSLQVIAPDEYHGQSTLEAHGGDIVGTNAVRKHVDPNDMSARNMQALANVEVTSGARKARVQEDFTTRLAPSTGLQSEDLKKVGDLMRKSSLTMNVNEDFFFGREGPLSNLGGTWKNLFHLIEQGKDVKGPEYVAKRNMVESAFYPEFGTCSTMKAKERPTYAALNTRELRVGGCLSYGMVSIKLKPEVKRRAVYSINDSFNSLPIEITAEKKELFLKALPSITGLSSEFLAKLADAKDEVHEKLQEKLDGYVAQGRISGGDLNLNIPKVPAHDLELMTMALMDLCKVKGAPRKENMATYDNLESLLPNMEHLDAMNMVMSAQNNAPTARMGYNYIEAQIHGEIRFPDDVEEIVYSSNNLTEDLISDGDKAFRLAVVEVMNGRKPQPAQLRLITQDQRAQLDDLRRQLNGRTIKMTYLSATEAEDDNKVSRQMEREGFRFATEHFNYDEAIAKVNATVNNHEASVNFMHDILASLGESNLGKDFVMPQRLVNAFTDKLNYYAEHRDRVPKSDVSGDAAIFDRVFKDALGSVMLGRLRTFIADNHPFPPEGCKVVVDILNGKQMTMVEMRRAAGLSDYLPFPVAKHPEKLPQTPQERRQFLTAMLPTYHAHESEGGYDYGSGTHSRSHICRAFIFAETMADIMEARHFKIDRAALTMGIVGHDSGRNKNGPDDPKMEAKSAQLSLQCAHERYGKDSTGFTYDEEFTKCIVGHSSSTLEGVLLNSADSLDIGRTKEFDMKYFPFLLGGSKTGEVEDPVDNKLRHDLQKEAQLLAILTDPACSSLRMVQGANEIGDSDHAVELMKMAQKDIIEQANMTDEEFIAFVENEIRKYPTVFPLLTEHYLNKLS